MNAFWPLALALIGAIVYLVASKATTAEKAAELGRIAYAVGLLVFTAVYLAHKVLSLGGK